MTGRIWMARALSSLLLAALLVFGPVQAEAARAGVSSLATAQPAAAGTAEGKPLGSSATPYLLVALGIVVALVLVIGSADSSDYDCDFGDAC
jgi:hypothetical protein